jgi:sugar lactone lactonase YvrE/predicted alpha/beta superfamily hydrolase
MMKAIPTSALAVLVLLALAPPSRGEADDYKPGPDSLPQAGVPQGELIRFDFADSKVFPGTTRHVTIYVPKQYVPAKPACVFVDQDGVQFKAPTVLDNLIARGELPVIIGVFVTPGVVMAQDPATQLSRFNRSFEYDGLGDAYARLLLDEILPAVETKATSDGRPVHLSHSGNDRAIAGSSSGAIAAFNAAWERPDQFSRVISAIGTYVSLRGGDRFPGLIRKYEPKPIRVFLQDGSGDLNIYGGDWWMANQTMERALTFSGYEVNHVWGDGHHSGNQITAELPNALRWVWKDWPRPVGNEPTQNGALKALLIPGEPWQRVVGAEVSPTKPITNSKGEIFYEDAKRLHKIALDGSIVALDSAPNSPAISCFGPDGRIYAFDAGDLVSFEPGSSPRIVTHDVASGSDIVVAHNGNTYMTDSGHVVLVGPGGTKRVLDSGLLSPGGVTLSPDQSLLYVSESRSHWIYSYQVKPNGDLADKQRYYWLHCSDMEDSSHAGSMCCDKAGWLYVATNLGIQICDQAGRVNAIVPTPDGKPFAVCLGGDHFDTLYAATESGLFKRKLNTTGANPWEAPTLPPAPKL